MNGYFTLLAILGAAIGGFVFGHHYQVLTDGYNTQQQAITQAADLATGQRNIIMFNQALDKELKDDKNPCINNSLPVRVNKLLY